MVGVLFSAAPAQAAPATSAEAAQLVAARGHDLEVVTEQFNEARATLDAQRATAQTAAAHLQQAAVTLGAAQQQVRGIARSAWTGNGLRAVRGIGQATEDGGGEARGAEVDGPHASVRGSACPSSSASGSSSIGGL